MEYLRVKNFEKWQHYKDRTPPWIKLHRDILNNYEFTRLEDHEKAHLMLLWLLASQTDNKIPNDPEWIGKKIGATKKVNVSNLIKKDFLESYQYASNALATCKQSAIRETEREGETEEKEPSDSVPQKSPDCPYPEIVALYHQTLPELPKVEKLTDARKTTIRKIWREDLKELDAWGHFFTYVRSSEFLMGNVAPINGRRVFKANLEWITKPANFVKISEEFYHG